VSDTKKTVYAIFRKVFGQLSLTRFIPGHFPDSCETARHFPVCGHRVYGVLGLLRLRLRDVRAPVRRCGVTMLALPTLPTLSSTAGVCSEHVPVASTTIVTIHL